MTEHQHILWVVLAGSMYVVGVLSAIHALLSTRTSQSAIAWAISCVTFPYLAVPAYWLFGLNRFPGYVLARRSSNTRLQTMMDTLRHQTTSGNKWEWPDAYDPSCRVLERLAALPFTRGNRVTLLIDGDTLYDAMFKQIERARDYVLIQFFIVRSDSVGMQLLNLLKTKVSEGVRVYFLYDQIGSHALSRRYITTLREAGVEMHPFKTTSHLPTRFQINFRNHRKVVLVDGSWAVTGGANLGEEYRSDSKRFGHWRDTMVSLEGPAVQQVQLAFVEDWFFATGEIPEMKWKPTEAASDGGSPVLVLPTGPADMLHNCSMMFTQIIHSATKKLWLTSPYFVPDKEIIRALQLAALRGVDVRILLPDKPDHYTVYLASFTYLEDLEQTGVKFFRYRRGLLHEKVVLVDDRLALIGSANTDNRSFYLNFEMTVLVADRNFVAVVKQMLKEDFSHSRRSGHKAFERKGLLFRLAAQLARLLSPIL